MEATVIYPHQLFNPSHQPALRQGRVVFLIEEPLFISEFGTHRQKMLLHRLSMQAYKLELEDAGFEVQYINIGLKGTVGILSDIRALGFKTLHIVDTTDNWLEERIANAASTYGFERVSYESPLFLLEKSDAVNRFVKSGRFMKKFYEKLRKDLRILIENDGTPVGGQWSFDSDNRNKIAKGEVLPADVEFIDNNDVRAAIVWLNNIDSEQYGESKVWVPYTRAAAQKFLQEFLCSRFQNFGPYEDAIYTTHTRLFHSTLSPLINIGLLSPREVLDAAIKYAKEKNIKINSLEGFVRQILGWREFIRASYESDGTSMRNKNFFNHERNLPASFWQAQTGIEPVDISITRALTYGYNHHIERLMVLGNFMLLSETKPDNVYRWFMSMYVDAYDWVMVPNIYGMSQFADGGSFATKPYISGSNYLQKMSNLPKGSWEELWTSLYWNFINTHRKFFSQNYRLSMMPKILEKMSAEKKSVYLKTAREYLDNN